MSMKSPLHHLKHPEWLFEYFHNKIHHAFVIFGLAIVGMLWGASNILTSTSASRQWWWFITSDFWGQNPSDANIMYALFGDWTPGSTAYTKLWNTSCVPTNVVTLSAWAGWPFPWNTIYVINSGNYIITNPITIDGDCTAIIGRGDVYIKAANSTITPIISFSGKNNIIIDNIKVDGQNFSTNGIDIDSDTNVTLNTMDFYNNDLWIHWFNWSTNISLYNAKSFNNQNGWYLDASNMTINNSLFYNNNYGLLVHNATVSSNNSQFFNNTYGIASDVSYLTINNSVFLDNMLWFEWQTITWIFNNVSLYNNTTWLKLEYSWYIDYYGTLQLFNNTTDYILSSSLLHLWSTTPISSRSVGQIDTWSMSMSYDRVTNPQNNIGDFFLNGTNRTTTLRWTQSFDSTQTPIRYIFWGNILKQTTPVRYHWTNLEEYGSDGYDYFTSRYIAEPESTLSAANQSLVNQYFWSGALYTQNWQTNWCSLSAFHVKTLNPSTTLFNSTYNFEDHTIYILTGGEYRSTVGLSNNGFVFNGNCIAIIGTSATRFTKSGWGGMNSIFYANNKHNIIIDTVKIDGLYFDVGSTSSPAHSAIKFDGANNNSTINNVQAYNTTTDWIYLWLGSHHNTIVNTQVFNNGSAGIHLYYSSNYNVINNTQTYNNNGYGIWFANWSNRNTINNFQSYNNVVWIFWDLTTKENVINRTAIYNNSDAGIYFKNSSGNMLNDVRVYNNTIGIRALYSSQGNKYYWELKIFDNAGGNFDGTLGNDVYFSAGTAGLFPYAGILSTGNNLASCLFATNPIISGTSLALLTSTCTNTWYTPLFQSPSSMYVNYAFGLNMYKQNIPVRYSNWNTLIQIPSQHDPSKYIAEMSAIRDTTPEGMSFLSSGVAQINTRYSTNIYTAGIINIPVPVTLSFTPLTTSGYLIISGNVVGLTWIVNNSDTVQIAVLTRTGYNQTITWMITLWSVTTWFSVTTRWINQTPDTGSFAFANIASVPLNTFTWSTTTIWWLETGVLASITFSPTATSGRLAVYSGTTLIHSGTTGLLVYNWYQVKAIAKSGSWYAQTVTGYITIGLWTGLFTIMTKWSDSTAPTIPTIMYPLSGENMFFVNFNWLVSTDTGSWLAWYVYQIARDASFNNIINTWFIATTTWSIGSPSRYFTPTNNHYYFRIQGRDNDGNSSARSNTGYFTIVNFTHRNFINTPDANLDTYYDSNEITLTGITTGALLWATLGSNGTLYQNGNNVGTGALVQNGDNIYITMKSSTMYDRTLSSSLTIANRVLNFNITTKQSSNTSCTLSDTDKSTIQTIFDSLIQNYSGDNNKFDTFLYTMQSMLADTMDFTNDCNLQYLQNLINSELGINWSGTINTGTWIAPNCKEYWITYDTTKMWYASPVFKVINYFANRDALGRYIDAQNPWDCHLNTYASSSWIFTNDDPSKHIASNGKIYTILSNEQWYTANEFITSKYFSTIGELRNYIDSKNPPQEVRSHVVDTTFTPQAYTAPNGNVYTIYKTDRWYMSYKLIKVRYFSTLTEIQYFIDKNNPK